MAYYREWILPSKRRRENFFRKLWRQTAGVFLICDDLSLAAYGRHQGRKTAIDKFSAAAQRKGGYARLGTETVYQQNVENRKRKTVFSVKSEFLKSINERFEKWQRASFAQLTAAQKTFCIFLVHLVAHYKRWGTHGKAQAVVKINIFLHGQVCRLAMRFSSVACGFFSPLSSEQQKITFTR